MSASHGIITAGTDEAGRGPLAGPVVAAAVILNAAQRKFLVEKGLRDSKKMTPRSREAMFSYIIECGALWKAQAASPRVIDRINILNASLWCMRRSVEKLRQRPDLVLVDGNRRIQGLMTAQMCIVKGDDKVPAIAAASVVAKVLRDRVMMALDALYPEYGFAVHKGYPSAMHRKILMELGHSPIHRLTFRGVCRVKRDDVTAGA